MKKYSLSRCKKADGTKKPTKESSSSPVQELLGRVFNRRNATKHRPLPWQNPRTKIRSSRDAKDTPYEPLWIGEEPGKCSPVIFLVRNGQGHQERHREMSRMLENEAVKAFGASGTKQSKQTI